jgi:transcriptional regulator with XRE-family HTH domain
MKRRFNMKKNSENIYPEVEEFFKESPTANQKAWGLINHFYHLILTYMEMNDIKQADLAKKLGKSRSAVSQIFKHTPNITIKKMVEIADAVGINIVIESPEINSTPKRKINGLKIPLNSYNTEYTSKYNPSFVKEKD